ncbi:MAG: acylneuraminate cytidylyltransferase family protein [Prosthecochloris sp.]|nr:acylneuraminate cytidylyltransferase family protein [Prosthecochloris sp.]
MDERSAQANRMVAVIPARGGSKGLPGKNIHPVAGKPLIAWSILQAAAAEGVEDVFVSTDSPSIAAVAEEYGARVITRPAVLSTDRASSEGALLHALDQIGERYGLDTRYAVFLQATSPLRLPGDIDAALARFRSEGADSLISVTRADDLTLWEAHEGKWRSVNFDYRNRGMRQDRPRQYIENGSIYIVSRDVLRQTANRIGQRLAVYCMEFWQTWEIDTLAEVELVEYFMRKKLDI